MTNDEIRIAIDEKDQRIAELERELDNHGLTNMIESVAQELEGLKRENAELRRWNEDCRIAEAKTEEALIFLKRYRALFPLGSGVDPLISKLENINEEFICSVILIRCSKHYAVPQQNKNEHSGAECGACIAEDRDEWKNQIQVRDDLLNQIMQFTDEEFSNESPVAGVERVTKERDDLRAQVVRMREALKQCTPLGLGPNTIWEEAYKVLDETCKVIAEIPSDSAKALLGPTVELLKEYEKCLPSPELTAELQRLERLIT